MNSAMILTNRRKIKTDEGNVGCDDSRREGQAPCQDARGVGLKKKDNRAKAKLERKT